MPQEWGHAEMTRWIDGETWRRRDEEAGEREMGDGGDGEMGGWGIVLRASKLPERVSFCMRRKCVVVARCTTAQAECLRVVHARAFLDLCTRAQFFWVFKLFSVGGGRSLRNFEICFARQFLCPESTVFLGGSSFSSSSSSSSHARNTRNARNTQRNKSKQMQTKMQPEFRMHGHEDTSMITNVVSFVSCVSCSVRFMFFSLFQTQTKQVVHP